MDKWRCFSFSAWGYLFFYQIGDRSCSSPQQIKYIVGNLEYSEPWGYGGAQCLESLRITETVGFPSLPERPTGILWQKRIWWEAASQLGVIQTRTRSKWICFLQLIKPSIQLWNRIPGPLPSSPSIISNVASSGGCCERSFWVLLNFLEKFCTYDISN